MYASAHVPDQFASSLNSHYHIGRETQESAVAMIEGIEELGRVLITNNVDVCMIIVFPVHQAVLQDSTAYHQR
jgi:hypothetical protein